MTGAAGFIGFHLVQRLLQRGDEVIGLDSLNHYYDVRLKYGRLEECGIKADQIDQGKLLKSDTNKNYSFVKENLLERDFLNGLFEREAFDGVCNLAAQAGVRYSLENPHIYIESNIMGFLNILEACRQYGVKHLSYASSSSVYGLNKSLPFSTSDNVDHPISLYAATKKSNELMAHTYSHLFELPVTGLRFFTVYGPWGRPDMALFLFTKAILEKRPIDVFNFGKMQRDFTYIDDIVEGIVRVIDNPPGENNDGRGLESKIPSFSRIYNIGNGRPVNLMDYIGAIEKKLGLEAKKNFLPMQRGDVPVTWADTSELEEDLNYRPCTGIEVGVSHFIDWYRRFFDI